MCMLEPDTLYGECISIRKINFPVFGCWLLLILKRIYIMIRVAMATTPR